MIICRDVRSARLIRNKEIFSSIAAPRMGAAVSNFHNSSGLPGRGEDSTSGSRKVFPHSVSWIFSDEERRALRTSLQQARPLCFSSAIVCLLANGIENRLKRSVECCNDSTALDILTLRGPHIQNSTCAHRQAHSPQSRGGRSAESIASQAGRFGTQASRPTAAHKRGGYYRGCTACSGHRRITADLQPSGCRSRSDCRDGRG